MRLFSNRSQKTSKCGIKNSDTLIFFSYHILILSWTNENGEHQILHPDQILYMEGTLAEVASYSWSILKGIFQRFSISFCGISPDSRRYEIKQPTHFRSFIGDPACFFVSVESNTWFNSSESVSEGSRNLYLIWTCLALQKVRRTPPFPNSRKIWCAD